LVPEGTLAKRQSGYVSFRAGEKPRMLTLFAVAAFVISVLFAMGEVAYKRSFPKVTGVFVALFLMLLVGSAFMH
jgi:integral membrane sensor domain MASE1